MKERKILADIIWTYEGPDSNKYIASGNDSAVMTEEMYISLRESSNRKTRHIIRYIENNFPHPSHKQDAKITNAFISIQKYVEEVDRFQENNFTPTEQSDNQGVGVFGYILGFGFLGLLIYLMTISLFFLLLIAVPLFGFAIYQNREEYTIGHIFIVILVVVAIVILLAVTDVFN